MDKVIKKRKFPIKSILVFLAAAGFIGTFFHQMLYVDKRPTVYAKTADLEIAVVRRGRFQEYINITGAIIPGDTLYLDALEGGQVKELFVETGDMVKKDDTILVLENTDLEMDELVKRAGIIEKQYELESARVSCEKKRHALTEQLIDLEYNLTQLEKDYKRNRKLHHSKYISTDEFEKIEDGYLYWKKKRDMLIRSRKIEERLMEKTILQIDAGLDLLEADFEKIRKRQADLTLKAPVSGLITSLEASVGETRNKGSRIARIDLTDQVKVKAEIDEYYVDRIFVGTTGTFTITDAATSTDTDYMIRLATISPEVRNNVFDGEFVFDGNPPENVRLGQSFTIRLALGESHDAVVLQKGPFIQNTGGSWVYVLDRNGKTAVRRPIKTGKNNPEFFEILTGLNPDDRVIISSYDEYTDMERIELN